MKSQPSKEVIILLSCLSDASNVCLRQESLFISKRNLTQIKGIYDIIKIAFFFLVCRVKDSINFSQFDLSCFKWSCGETNG